MGRILTVRIAVIILALLWAVGGVPICALYYHAMPEPGQSWRKSMYKEWRHFRFWFYMGWNGKYIDISGG